MNRVIMFPLPTWIPDTGDEYLNAIPASRLSVFDE